MRSGADRGEGGGGGVWGGLLEDKFVDLPLGNIEPVMTALGDVVARGNDREDEGITDEVDLRPDTKATKP